MTEKKIGVLFRIEPELKAKAEKLAAERGMTLSAFIRLLLVQTVNRNKTIEEEIDELKARIEALENKK